MWCFNDSQRKKMDAAWALTVLVVDALDDSDGLFPLGLGWFPAAFALSSGLYMVVPSGRSAFTIEHDLRHIFWAFDDECPEEASWYARRGY
mmetsp:Transcript_18241/g.36720  ORF Transcript_18241/g.36720 Transcript_18241/m.36720 type:complete len:91 (-) Transcript_18241:1414-1686(-)